MRKRGRPSPTTDARVRIGREVLAALDAGVPWKIILRRYKYGHTRLYMFVVEARKANHDLVGAGALGAE